MTAPKPAGSPRISLWRLIAAVSHQPGPLMTAVRDPDLPWLHRVRIGDPMAQHQYVGRYWSTVLEEARAYGRRGGPEDDLVGEGALALWEAAFSYDSGRHRTDLDHYVANQIHRRVRRAYVKAMGYGPEARTVSLGDALPKAPAVDDSTLSAVEWRADVARAVRDLDAEDRTSILRTLDAPDSARTEGPPLTAQARKRLERARRRLRERLYQ